MARPFLLAMLLAVGSGPAMAVCRVIVKEYQAESARRAQRVAAPAARREEATRLPASPASAVHRSPAAADSAASHWTASAGAPPFSLGGGAAPAFAPTRGVNAAPSAPTHVALATRPSSRAAGGGRFVPPTPATAYSFPSLIVDSTDNPGGLTGIGSGDTLSVTNGNFIVGNNHTGTFTQTGGAASTSGNNAFILGLNAGSNGTYNLSSGTLTLGGFLYVGYDGIGTFNQSGGTVTPGGTYTLVVGQSDNSNSAYFLTNGTLNTLEVLVSNHTNVSSFNQSNGTVNTQYVVLSRGTSDSNGTYNFNGGTLNAFAIASGLNSVKGTSTFNFNGGTLSPTQSDRPNGPNPYTFLTGLTTAQVRDGGAIVDTKGFNITFAQPLIHSTIGGDNATDGGLTKLGAGTLTLTAANTYTGTTNVTAGTLALGATGSLIGPGNVYVGINGTGTMNQDGGSLQLNNGASLVLGLSSGDRGTYNLTAGSINTSQVIIGSNGVGTMNQSGGSVTTYGTANAIFVGNGVGASSYILNGPGTIDTGRTIIGTRDNFIATFTQSAGTHNTGQLLLSGVTTGSTGVYNLDGGTLNTGSVGSGYFGVKGTSIFQFNGGTLRPTASDNPGAAMNPTTFFGGLTSAVVRDGGAKIDTNGFNVTLNQPLLHSNAGGDAATDGGLSKSGAGTLTLIGANSYTGLTQVYGGALAVASGGNLGSTGAVVIVNGSELDLSGTGSITTNNLYLTTGTVNQTGGTFTLTTGSSFLAGQGGNSFYNLSGGTLSTKSAFLGQGGAMQFNQTGGDFTTNGNVLFVGYNDGSNTTYNLSAGSLTTGQTYVSDDVNTSTFTQTGGVHTTGQLVIGRNDAASIGTYNLNGGDLNTNSVNGGGANGTTTFNFNGGTLRARGSTTTFFQGVQTARVRNGGAIIDSAGYDITVAQNLFHSTLAGDNATDGGLTKNGAGNLTLTGLSDYNGGTFVNAGTLTVGSGANIQDGSVYVGAGAATGNPTAGATLVVNGTGQTFSMKGSASFYVDGTAASPSLVSLADTGTIQAFDTQIGRFGAGEMIQQGGSFSAFNMKIGVMGGSNGDYQLSGGTLRVTEVAGGSGTSTFAFGGGTLQAATNNANFFHGLTSATVYSGGAIFDTNGSNVTVTQPLLSPGVIGQGAPGGLTKNNAGVLTLIGASTYTGATSVNGGTLLANNTTGSATGTGDVTVYTGATLGGSGSIDGSVTINSGATLSPGNSPGRLTVKSGLTLSNGSTFKLELGGLAAGSQYDQMAVGGVLTLGGNLSVTTVNGFTLAMGQKFFIIDETGSGAAGTGAFANTFFGFYTDAAGNSYFVNPADIDPADNDGRANDVSLTVITVAIPEPSAWALLLLGVGSVALLRGRRRRRSEGDVA